MDIDLARTFLEIMSSGSFSQASQRLHVSQTTVTTRIHTLEQQLGCRLFVRNRSGARLTPEGRRFAGHAATLVQTWEQARADMRLPAESGHRIGLGAETSLWHPLLANWVLAAGEARPDIYLTTTIGEAPTLIEKLENHQLDAIVLHRPGYYSGLVVEQLMEEKLVLVQAPEKPEPSLFIDWGPAFRAQYEATQPQKPAAMAFDFGPLALRILLARGGNGYFRTRVVQPYLEEGRLSRVEGAPEFSYPVYLTCRTGSRSPDLQALVDCLKASVREDAIWPA